MAKLEYAEDGRLLFTEEMKKEYTILFPMMLPIHFGMLEQVLKENGYKVDLLKTTHSGIIDEGLEDVHNDTCYPALLVIGQLLDAVKSGKYDTNKIALMITQTGGGCRASNYIHMLRKALKKNNLEHIPVVSFNLNGMEKNPGFKINFKLIKQLITAVILGDMLTCVSNQTRPYEVTKGETDKLVDEWSKRLLNEKLKITSITSNMKKIAHDFAQIKVRDEKRVKVGIVGEIYIKYAPLGNNNLEAFLQDEGCEVVVPGLLDYVIFVADTQLEDTKMYGINKKKGFASWFMKLFFNNVKNKMIKVISKYPQFTAPSKFKDTKSLIKGYLSPGTKMGEGWLLTAEMLELIHSGVENIVCAQPFGCLPNHIVGKGMVKKIRENHPDSNIVAIDYDPGATKINQENRIKLMLSVAREKLNPKPEEHKFEIVNTVDDNNETLSKETANV